MSVINMNAYHLRKSEIQYELKIRGESTEGSAYDLRKRLIACFSNNTEVIEAIVNELQPDAELEQCEEKFMDLSSLVEEYDGDFKDRESQRLLERLGHLSMRLERIPIPVSADDDLEIRKTELLTKTRTLVNTLKGVQLQPPPQGNVMEGKEKILEESQLSMDSLDGHTGLQRPIRQVGVSMATSEDCGRLATAQQKPNQDIALDIPSEREKTTLARVAQRQELQYRVTVIPVYKWGLRFDNGRGQSIAAFLQRVEELRRARGVSNEELFNSAVDLFAGPALVWYRSTLGRISSWEALCAEMRIVFQSPDHDIKLQQEIFNRGQGEHEPIDLFIASMEGMYERLAVKVPEEIRLRQISYNMHPQLKDRLALFEIKSLEELRLLGRKAEMGRLRSAAPRQTPINRSTVEPDLAYNDHQHLRPLPPGRVSSLQITGNQLGKCWNCGNHGHRHADCTRKRKKFCYGCGNPDVIRSSCSRCQPKNL